MGGEPQSPRRAGAPEEAPGGPTPVEEVGDRDGTREATLADSSDPEERGHDRPPSSAPASSPLRVAVGAATLVLIAAVLSTGTPSRLIWDDHSLIGAVDASQGWDLGTILLGDFFDRGSSAEEVHYYRPLSTLSYRAGDRLFGGSPFGHGVANLILHCLACGLLYWLLGRWGAGPWAAALGAAAFGLMPRLTESVYWISGRTDILAACFVLAALVVEGRHGYAGRHRRVWMAVLLFLGLLAKEVAIAGFVVVLARDASGLARSPGDRSERGPAWRAFAARAAPLLIALVAYGALRFAAIEGGLRTSVSLGLASRLALAAEALGRFGTMLLDPVHPALRIGSLWAPRDVGLALFGLLCATVGLLAIGWLWRRHPDRGELSGLILAGSSLGLVLHLAPTGSDTVTADRFLYLPVAGLALSATLALARLSARPARIAAGATAVMVILFAAACVERAGDWSDDVLLWHHTLLHSDPIDSLPHAWMGAALLERDEPAAAMSHFKRALQIEMARSPETRKGTLIIEQLANMSLALSAMGRDEEALHAIDQAIRQAPDRSGYRLQRARVLGRLLRFEEARATLLATRPDDGSAADLRAAADQLARAEQLWRALPPAGGDESAETLVTRARILEGLGALPAAAAIWRQVLRDPNANAELVAAAAAFHTFRADPKPADALIDRLARQSPAYERQASVLRAALDLRRSQAVPTSVLHAAQDLEGHS